MKSQTSPRFIYVGITLFDLLFVMFLGLKLGNFAQLEWWQVFAPLFAPTVYRFVTRTWTHWRTKKISFEEKENT